MEYMLAIPKSNCHRFVIKTAHINNAVRMTYVRDMKLGIKRNANQNVQKR